MKKVNVSPEWNVLAVIAPRKKGSAYMAIMGGVVRAIDVAKYNNPEKTKFLFITTGIPKSALDHVKGALNIFYDLMRPRGQTLRTRTHDLDIEFYGKKSEENWVNEVLQYNPDVFLVIDDGETPVAKYAIKVAEDNNIEVVLVKVPKAKEEKVF